MITNGHGNLLDSQAEALVNTVNTVGVAGKGIALQFRQAFPANFKAYAAACKRGEVVPGRMFVFDTGRLGPGRYIINFPTKRHWRGGSRLSDIKEGLDDLVRVISDYDIKSVAVPPLGCGNGGLDWDDVEPLITAALVPLERLHVELFAPDGAPSNDAMPVATKRPGMTPQRAAVIALFGRYLIPEYRLTALEAQKLAYFLQVLGQPMNLAFVKAQYGPYAEVLNHALQSLEGHFTRGYGDRTTAVALYLMPGATEEADRYLASDSATKSRVDRAALLVRGFETPYGLELLATVHWALNELDTVQLDPIVEYVRGWTRRKGELFSRSHVERAITHLAANSLTPAQTKAAYS